jgi:hypothetical protein
MIFGLLHFLLLVKILKNLYQLGGTKITFYLFGLVLFSVNILVWLVWLCFVKLRKFWFDFV